VALAGSQRYSPRRCHGPLHRTTSTRSIDPPAGPGQLLKGNSDLQQQRGIFAFLSNNARVTTRDLRQRRNTAAGSKARKAASGWSSSARRLRHYHDVLEERQGLQQPFLQQPKGGLGTEDIPSLEAYNNVFFGNDLAQVHFRKGDGGRRRASTPSIATEKQGVPFLRGK
jgi:hypothetical protein